MGQRFLAAAGQLGPGSEDKQENVARMVALVEQAAREGVRLIAFPELAATRYLPLASVPPGRTVNFGDAEPFEALQPVLRAAADAGMVLALPFIRAADGEHFNSLLVADADGRLLGYYDKAHIPAGERPYFAGGRLGFRVFETAVGKVGALICADRSFPAAWRALALGGAEVVVSPYNTSEHVPHNRSSERPPLEALREQQALRMRASANMNGYYVVAPGKAGDECGSRYIGDSMVISSWGDVVARSTTAGAELVCAEVDLDVVAETKRGLGLDWKRRPDLYGMLAR